MPSSFLPLGMCQQRRGKLAVQVQVLRVGTRRWYYWRVTRVGSVRQICPCSEEGADCVASRTGRSTSVTVDLLGLGGVSSITRFRYRVGLDLPEGV